MSGTKDHLTAHFSSPAHPEHHFSFPLNETGSLSALIERLTQAKAEINEHLTKVVDEERSVSAAAGDRNGSAHSDPQVKRLKSDEQSD